VNACRSGRAIAPKKVRISSAARELKRFFCGNFSFLYKFEIRGNEQFVGTDAENYFTTINNMVKEKEVASRINSGEPLSSGIPHHKVFNIWI